MAEAKTTQTVTLTMSETEAQLLCIAAAKFAVPQRGNLASRAAMEAIAANAACLTQATRDQIAADMDSQTYTSGDPWTDMDSAYYAAMAQRLRSAS